MRTVLLDSTILLIVFTFFTTAVFAIRLDVTFNKRVVKFSENQFFLDSLIDPTTPRFYILQKTFEAKFGKTVSTETLHQATGHVKYIMSGMDDMEDPPRPVFDKHATFDGPIFARPAKPEELQRSNFGLFSKKQSGFVLCKQDDPGATPYVVVQGKTSE